jgi:hypothetical protein
MIGRLGGMTPAARNDTRRRALTGQSAFRASFADGHGSRVCPLVEIPADLDIDDRQRRANILYRMHFVRIAMQRKRRRPRGSAPVNERGE